METGEGHIGYPGYFGVFAILVVGTLFTYWSSFWDLDAIFPGANTLLALAIAFTKMTFVMLFFMHVWHSRPLTWLAAGAGFVWLAILFGLAFTDYAIRSPGP